MYQRVVDDVVRQLGTDTERGLTQKVAAARLAEHGPNELVERPRPGPLRMLLQQFDNFLVLILIAAAVISLSLGEIVDASAILVIVLLNAVLGVIQESKAEQALAALKRMSAPNSQVIRDGLQVTIPARELVPGDVVLLEAGNYVPADVRLVEAVNLRVDESSLTGESAPVVKDAAAVLPEDVSVGDRLNSAFMSTMVTYGRGRGVVVATGMRTEIGRIAELIQSYEDEETPLQLKLNQLGKWLGIASLVVCGIIFVIGIARDAEPSLLLAEGLGAYVATHNRILVELFMVAVSLAIAAVPEGLPAVVTICLALGMQRMVRRHALIRKLPAVETLGCATVICSDKTGTLTQNEMTVVRGWTTGSSFEVTGEGYDPIGRFQRGGEPFAPHSEPPLSTLLVGAMLCNDARLEQHRGDDGHAAWRIVGDPTEGALTVAATKSGLHLERLVTTAPRVAEIPFDSGRKRMTTIHEIRARSASTALQPLGDDGRRDQDGCAWTSLLARSTPDGSPVLAAFVKGAPDVVLDLSTDVLLPEGFRPLDDGLRDEIHSAMRSMASQALRVLGVAYRPLSSLPREPDPEEIERDLVFVGLLGMIDPARPEARDAIAVAKLAGLKSIMVTGDHKETATAIAEEIGLRSAGGRVVTGAELERTTDEELAGFVEQVDAFARVSPEHKVRIVDALKARGHVVAMTGDGVNDAPALKRANIGVAMGITGTDVAKNTADVVLTDDNFASIVAAVEEGRIIYANIRKFVFYLISCNVSEILIVFLAMLGGLPVPLRPIHLLWLNLATDGAPALALGLEKGDPDIMKQPPRPPEEPIINREMRLATAVQAIAKPASVLVGFVYGLQRFPGHLEAAQTMALTILVVSELLRAYTSRSEHHSVFSIGIFSNRWMVLATSVSFALLLIVMYVPLLQPVFGTVPLGPTEWLVMLPLMLVSPVAAEVAKVFLRRRPDRLAAIPSRA